MERRAFLGALVAGAAVGACEGPKPRPRARSTSVDGDGPRTVWRLASSFPRSLDTIYGAAEVLAERVAAMTDGRFEIRVYPAGEVVPPFQVLDAVQQGTVPIGQTAGYYYLGKHPALAFDTCVPFGFTARQQAAWLDEGGGRALIDEVLAGFGALSLPSGNTGAQMGGWFRREIRSLADLGGLNMRIPGLGGRVMSALGAQVQSIPGADIFPALERGVIDATEWVGPYDDEKLGFASIAPVYHTPGWWEPGPSLSFYVSRAAFDGLPVAWQHILRAAAREAAHAMLTRYDARNPDALARLVAAGTRVVPFPADLLDAAAAASRQLLSDEAAKDPVTARVVDHWTDFKSRSDPWFATAELPYTQAVWSALAPRAAQP